ncbi:MAG: elongation factor 1-beta family protein [Candidatus Anstonellales archaeon]
MANVVMIMNVNISEQDKIDSIAEEIKKKLNVSDIKKEDIGFGIKRLKIAVMLDDEKGSDVEQILYDIDGISSVETISVTRV